MTDTLVAPAPVPAPPEANPDLIPGPVIVGTTRPEVTGAKPDAGQVPAEQTSEEPASPTNHTTEAAAPDVEALEAKKPFYKRMGRVALIGAGVEAVGIAVDAALMGAGRAGVAIFNSVFRREAFASAGDTLAYSRWLPHKHGEALENQTRLQKVGRHAGNLALGVTTAVVAQKVGPHAVQYIHSSLTHGVSGEYIVPLTSKVTGMAGMNTIRGRIKSRLRRH